MEKTLFIVETNHDEWELIKNVLNKYSDLSGFNLIFVRHEEDCSEHLTENPQHFILIKNIQNYISAFIYNYIKSDQ